MTIREPELTTYGASDKHTLRPLTVSQLCHLTTISYTGNDDVKVDFRYNWAKCSEYDTKTSSLALRTKRDPERVHTMFALFLHCSLSQGQSPCASTSEKQALDVGKIPFMITGLGSKPYRYPVLAELE